ncbi:D-inositol-3-phosphate glycosyltransferase [subsurface metagenome]
MRTDATRSHKTLVERLNMPPDKVTVIPVLPTAESIAKFTEANGDVVRKKLLENKYDKIVLFVGVLEKVKNIPNLLRATKQILSAHIKTLFLIIGSGPEKDHLEVLSQELGIAEHVRFPGIIPYEDLPAYYVACDLLVLPSWSEGFARVLMEAAFAAKPIVATDVGGVDDIITNDETGYIVAVNDSKQLAEKITKLLDDPERARQMGLKGYQRAVSYGNFDANTRKLVGAWKSLLASNGGGG